MKKIALVAPERVCAVIDMYVRRNIGKKVEIRDGENVIAVSYDTNDFAVETNGKVVNHECFKNTVNTALVLLRDDLTMPVELYVEDEYEGLLAFADGPNLENLQEFMSEQEEVSDVTKLVFKNIVEHIYDKQDKRLVVKSGACQCGKPTCHIPEPSDVTILIKGNVIYAVSDMLKDESSYVFSTDVFNARLLELLRVIN